MPIYLNPISDNPFQFTAVRNPYHIQTPDGAVYTADTLQELQDLQELLGLTGSAQRGGTAGRLGSRPPAREPLPPRPSAPVPPRAPKSAKELWSSASLEAATPAPPRQPASSGRSGMKGQVSPDLYYRVALACGGPAALCPAWSDPSVMERFTADRETGGQMDPRFKGVFNIAGVYRLGGSKVAKMLESAGVTPQHIMTLALEFAAAGVLPEGNFDYNVVAAPTGGVRRLSSVEKDHNKKRFFEVTNIACPIALKANPRRRRL